MLEKAILLATQAHGGQKDKGGQPYILHPLRVMLQCQGEHAQIAGVLHDVLEDTTVTKEQLLQEGFSDEIVKTVECLTRKKDEDYFEYIARIGKHSVAKEIKLADLADNMDMSRISMPTERDWARREKYQKAKEVLERN